MDEAMALDFAYGDVKIIFFSNPITLACTLSVHLYLDIKCMELLYFFL